ncbi:MAG TPA: cell division protein FtsZ, partial [Armatimonadetes bacterium]|nr:cell division protein FtsZ [Armatimonadota bacterium]
DFADVKTVLADAGTALMGIGRATGEQRAAEAARAAISSPLLEASIEGARNVLFNVTGPPDLTLAEVDEAAQVITEAIDSRDANVIWGLIFDENMGEEVCITVVATGFEPKPKPPREAREERQEARAVEEERPARFAIEHRLEDIEEEIDIPTFLRTSRRSE